MPRTRTNMLGQKFGRLTVIGEAPSTPKHANWECLCDCGKRVVVRGSHLRFGDTQSCTCLRNDLQRLNHKTIHGHARKQLRTPEYNSWDAMAQRCTNPHTARWKNYGGANPPVTVCERWLNSFEAFLQDVGSKPSPEHSLGRILDMGNYEAGNVFWMTPAEQGLAKRNKHALLKWAAERDTAVLERLAA